MLNLKKGELYEFSKAFEEAEPVYAVFDESVFGCSYVKFLIAEGRFETECCLPEEYDCARPVGVERRTAFEKTLESYRSRLFRIGRCLSEWDFPDVETGLRELSIRRP